MSVLNWTRRIANSFWQHRRASLDGLRIGFVLGLLTFLLFFVVITTRNITGLMETDRMFLDLQARLTRSVAHNDLAIIESVQGLADSTAQMVSILETITDTVTALSADDTDIDAAKRLIESLHLESAKRADEFKATVTKMNGVATDSDRRIAAIESEAEKLLDRQHMELRDQLSTNMTIMIAFMAICVALLALPLVSAFFNRKREN